MKRTNIFFILLPLLFLTATWPAKAGELSGKLIIFHAGSLSLPFKKIGKEFNKLHPKLKILRESAASRTSARKISELGRKSDVMASADYTVIDELLVPEHADWNIKFASNEMTIAYNKHSQKADEISEYNWHNILMRKEINFGRSDPNTDPCGYRAALTIKLAETFYSQGGLAHEMLRKNKRFIRSKEVDLLALLEVNIIDYIFIYRSVAEQHGLKFIALPDKINLKNPKFTEYYKKVHINISGKKPGSFIVKEGGPMVYGVTIPKNPPNPKAALAFMEFLLDKNKGMAIMKKMGQPSVVPSQTDNYHHIPDKLKKYALPPAE